MKITVLDASTLGNDLDLSPLSTVGETECFDTTLKDEIAERIKTTDIIITNKVKLNAEVLLGAKNLKLICVFATGYDNIDIDFCNENGIRVCNVVGYSTDSVAQVTLSGVLYLMTHLKEYTEYVRSGEYSRSGLANKVSPVFSELCGKTWGIVGYGNIGRKVGDIARAFGCKVIAYKRNPSPDVTCVDFDTLCREADIISLHTPLNDETRGLIGERALSLMKPTAILYNASRGAVTDENAVAKAVIENKISAFGSDVYSVEPMAESHPFYSIKELPSVCLTPHMAWASKEARERCLSEIIENIKAFYEGRKRNCVTKA